jgi:hypothetical protein
MYSIAPDDLKQLADDFAFELCFTPHDGLSAGLRAFKGDMLWTGWAVAAWMYHPYILEKKQEFIEEYGADYFLPTKEQVIQKAMHIAEVARDRDDQLRGLRLVAEMLDILPKGNKGVNLNLSAPGGTQTNKVMVIKDHGDDWEKKAAAQQATLERRFA